MHPRGKSRATTGSPSTTLSRLQSPLAFEGEREEMIEDVKTAGREVGIAGQILRHAVPRTSLITAVLSSSLLAFEGEIEEKRELITGPGGQR